MSLLPVAIGPLLRKELRQIGRSRRAMLTATLLPFVLMVVTPFTQLLSLRGAAARAGFSTTTTAIGGVGVFGGLSSPTDLFTAFLLPLFVTLGGVVVPSVAAAYTVVTEREKNSLELLIALPVTVRDIVVAKLLAMLILALLVVLPMYAIDVALVLALGVATIGYLLLLTLVLVSALLCSVSEALLIALLARDFRTANNLNGVFVVPLLVCTIGVLAVVPGQARLLALSAMLLLIGILATVAALRWLTFERYLA